MAPPLKFTVQVETLLADAVQAATILSAVMKVGTARTIEIWIEITDNAGGGNFDFDAETSIDEDQTTKVFDIEKSVTGITAVGIEKIVINRADNAVGNLLRVNAKKNSGTDLKFKIRAIRME